jgi:RHS repeat-associated protein
VHDKVSEAAVSTPYKYTGKEQDPETGLYYYGARYYDPVLSRWVSVDKGLPKFLPKNDNINNLPGLGGVYRSLNMDAYSYCMDNPIIYYDPNGLWTFQIGLSGNGAIGAGGAVGVGIIFGHGDEQGFDLGVYGDIGVGGYSGVLLSATVDFALSFNENVHDVSGNSLGVGGSGKLGIDIGGQVNYQYNTQYSNIYTANIGIGAVIEPYILPVEGHMRVEKTGVATIKDLVNYLGTDFRESETTVSPVISPKNIIKTKAEGLNQNSPNTKGFRFGNYCDATGEH